MDISWRIKSLLKDNSLTQKQLSSKTDLSQAFISDLCNGKKTPNLETLGVICHALGISMSEFFKPFDPTVKFNPAADSCTRRIRYLPEHQIKIIEHIVTQFEACQPSYIVDAELTLLPILGSAAAGSPINSPSFPGESILVPSKFGDPTEYYAITARGSSMTPKIMDGDHVVVKYSSSPLINDLVLVRADGIGDDGYSIKILRSINKVALLESINPDYPPLSIPASDIHSLERIVYIIHTGSV